MVPVDDAIIITSTASTESANCKHEPSTATSNFHSRFYIYHYTNNNWLSNHRLLIISVWLVWGNELGPTVPDDGRFIPADPAILHAHPVLLTVAICVPTNHPRSEQPRPGSAAAAKPGKEPTAMMNLERDAPVSIELNLF